MSALRWMCGTLLGSLASVAAVAAQQLPWDWRVDRDTWGGSANVFAQAWDPVRGRIVNLPVGGSLQGPDMLYLDGTWEWSAGRWHQRFPAASPPPRTGARMAYDHVNQSVLLFGGLSWGQLHTDTWLWDGRNWQEVQPPGPLPMGRVFHGMAADPLRRRIVLLGGTDGSPLFPGVRTDTWEWDGGRWIQHFPINTPPSSWPTLAFDATVGKVAAVSGQANTVWHWDGQDWQPTVGNGIDPGLRGGPSLSTDPISGGLIMAGGSDGRNYRDEVFRWNGQGWQLLGRHPDGYQMSMSEVDPGRGVLVFPWVGSGYWQMNGWELDLVGGTWRSTRSGGIPEQTALFCAFCEFAPWRDQFLVVELNAARTQHWSWWVGDGGWELAASSGPFTLSDLAVHEDAQIVLALSPYGWDRCFSFRNNHWSAEPTPPGAWVSELAGYDPVRRKVLGVQGGAGTPTAIWGWDPGNGWVLLDGNGPPATFGVSAQWQATLDRERNTVVCLETNGQDTGTIIEWDGSSWTTTAVAMGRSVSVGGAVFEWVPGLGCVYCTGPHGVFTRDNLVWDGSTVRPLQTALPRKRQQVVGGSYDRNHHRLRLLTREPGSGPLQFWDLEPRSLQASEAEPRPGARVTLSLQAPGHGSEFWITGFSTRRTPALPRFSLPGHGTRYLSLGVEPLLLQSVFWGIGGLLDAQGNGQAYLTVPNLPWLDGLVLHAQAISLGAQGFGHVSNPLRVTVTR